MEEEKSLVRPEPIHPFVQMFPSVSEPQEELTCEICGASFPEDINMGSQVTEMLHLQPTVRVPHQACPPCTIVYVQVVCSEAYQPVQEDQSQCDECKVQFKSKRGLRQHIGKVHLTEEKSMTCSECNKKFKHKYAVKFHVKQVHDKATRVNCCECGKEFYNKYILQTHLKAQHEP